MLANPSGPDGPEAPGINNALLGLGYRDRDAGVSAGWDAPLWGLFLAPRTVAHAGRTGDTKRIGALSLGAVDPVYAAGDPVWLNLTETAGPWAVRLEGLSAGAAAADTAYFAQRQIDVAPVPGIGLPPAALDGLMAQLAGARKWTQDGDGDGDTVWTLPCDATHSLEVRLQGKTVTLAPEDWIANEGDRCRALLTATEGRPWLGTPFLSTVYSVWDLETPRLGLAPAKASPRIENKDFADGPAPARQSAQPVTTGKTYPAKAGQDSGAAAARPGLGLSAVVLVVAAAGALL